MVNNPYLSVLKSLAEAGVRPLIAGGVAASLYGNDRVTFDLDLLIALDRDVLTRALSCLTAQGFVFRLPVTIEEASDPDILRTWVEERNLMELVLVDPATGLEVGFLISSSGYFEEFTRRAESFRIGDVQLAVVSLRDLIAMKREAGRPKDLQDIAFLERLL